MALPSGSLFDFQVNGFAGVDFYREDVSAAEMRRAADALREAGAGRFFLTLVSDKVERQCRKLERFERMRAQDPVLAGAIAGYHLEGPWISPEDGYRGAHARDRVGPPRPGEFARLQAAAGGQVRLVTVAPEVPEVIATIAEMTRAGVAVSLGHTAATEAEIDGAVAAGARFCTHVGNGTPGLLPRHDNIIQRLLARDDLIACFIPDGIHLPPSVLRNFVRAKPAGKVLFTTDAMAGAGAPPGRYTLGPMEAQTGSDGIARPLTGSGFAGSTLTPIEGVQRTARWLNLSEDDAVRLWSQAPLEAFHVSHVPVPPIPGR